MPSPPCGVLGLEKAFTSWVQPSEQQMPSIAFSDANATSIRTAASLRIIPDYMEHAPLSGGHPARSHSIGASLARWLLLRLDL